MVDMRLFLELIRRRTPPPVADWLGAIVPGNAEPFAHDVFAAAFAAAARRLGKATLTTTADEDAALARLGITWPLGGWGLDELGRVALLLSAVARLDDARLEGLVEDCYSHGDVRERQATLRALPLLPAPERFLPIAVDACRSHMQPVFEAIACENPYPATCFPDLNFNQMVLKALFTGVALARIVGLSDRVTPELTRMADDYASERRAAGRTVPADIGLAAGKRSVS
ncbi:MAG: EboA domain-containing protein [Candidatus Rokubacteria bacterium]|nr:EboA domain-containing protein [Candidatus Rokubacteria bacterium]